MGSTALTLPWERVGQGEALKFPGFSSCWRAPVGAFWESSYWQVDLGFELPGLLSALPWERFEPTTDDTFPRIPRSRGSVHVLLDSGDSDRRADLCGDQEPVVSVFK